MIVSQKICYKKAINIKQIYQIDNWARTLTKLKYKIFRSKFLAKIIPLYILTNLNAKIVNIFKCKGNNRIPTETIKVYGDCDRQSFSEADINKIQIIYMLPNFLRMLKYL